MQAEADEVEPERVDDDQRAGHAPVGSTSAATGVPLIEISIPVRTRPLTSLEYSTDVISPSFIGLNPLARYLGTK